MLLSDFGKSEEYIHDHVWASDRYGYPLQIANLSLTSPDSLNLKNIVFQHNALSLKISNQVEIVDPETGKSISLVIPAFDYIISNLPFVGSNDRNAEDQIYIDNILSKFKNLDDKTDLYQDILLQLETLLSDNPNACIGVITSNSWTKIRKDYKSFFKTMSSVFDVEMVVQPYKGRWFQNAKVVTTIIVLKRKIANTSALTRFSMLKNGLINGGHEEQLTDLVDDIKLGEPNDLYYEHRLAYSSIYRKN